MTHWATSRRPQPHTLTPKECSKEKGGLDVVGARPLVGASSASVCLRALGTGGRNAVLSAHRSRTLPRSHISLTSRGFQVDGEMKHLHMRRPWRATAIRSWTWATGDRCTWPVPPCVWPRLESLAAAWVFMSPWQNGPSGLHRRVGSLPFPPLLTNPLSLCSHPHLFPIFPLSSCKPATLCHLQRVTVLDC